MRGEAETVYLGGVYELDTKGNAIVERFYVHNDERAFAVVERLATGDAWRYVHTDHLGSVDVITDSGGQEIDRRSFDAWGAPRDPKWGGGGAPSSNTATRRGFTWHEWDDDVGLVNAGGRIYDPKIARFLQTDPVIADVLDAQTQNPYSYVFNRPLVMTDPSGFEAEAHSVLLQGAGTPGYATPEQAQLVQDHQKTWLMQWTREHPATGPPASSVVEWGPAGADPAPSAPEKVGLTDSWGFRFGKGMALEGVTGVAASYMRMNLAISTMGTSELALHTGMQVQAAINGYPNGGILAAAGDAYNVGNPLNQLGETGARLYHAIDSENPEKIGAASLPVAAAVVGLVGARFAPKGGPAPRTNLQLVQDIATRAQAKFGGSGPVAGSLKHAYARRLLERYQSLFGQRGLRTEVSFLNGGEVKYGRPGSVRIDVWNVAAKVAYDYKFVRQPPGLLPGQTQRIQAHGPPGITVIEVNP